MPCQDVPFRTASDHTWPCLGITRPNTPGLGAPDPERTELHRLRCNPLHSQRHGLPHRTIPGRTLPRRCTPWNAVPDLTQANHIEPDHAIAEHNELDQWAIQSAALTALTKACPCLPCPAQPLPDQTRALQSPANPAEPCLAGPQRSNFVTSNRPYVGRKSPTPISRPAI